MVFELQVKWPKVIIEWEKPYINWIDLGNYTMFRLISFITTKKGIGLYVGVERLGNYIFATDKPMAWQYVSEKLSVPESDARALADWMNVQMDFDHKQQGHYSFDVIRAVEPYGLGSEPRQMPWIPAMLNAQ